MTFAKQAGAALLAIALLSSPALADPTETRSGRQGCELAVHPDRAEGHVRRKTLTLSGVKPSVVMFTDRPARAAEAIPPLRSSRTGVSKVKTALWRSAECGPDQHRRRKLQIGRWNSSNPSRRHDPDLSGACRRRHATRSGGATSVFIDGGCNMAIRTIADDGSGTRRSADSSAAGRIV